MKRWPIVVLIALAGGCTTRNPVYLTDGSAADGQPIGDGLARDRALPGEQPPRLDRRTPERQIPTADLPPTCGNGMCQPGKGETCKTCPKDCGECPVICGDSVCAPTETCFGCPKDCGLCCGNGVCDGNYGETCQSCAKDCGSCCGNTKCEPGLGETCVSCPKDCGSCGGCGDLSAQYLKALTEARMCSPMLPVLQCEMLVNDKIACGCPTHVNAQQKNAVYLMTQLQQQYQAAKCQNVCPPMPCPVTAVGLCLPNSGGTGGSCIDK